MLLQALTATPIGGQDDNVHAFDDDDDGLASVISRFSLSTVHTAQPHYHGADAFTSDHGFQPINLPKKFAHARSHHTPSKTKPLTPGVGRTTDTSPHAKNSNMSNKSNKSSHVSPGRAGGVNAVVLSGIIRHLTVMYHFDTCYTHPSAFFHSPLPSNLYPLISNL